MSRLVEEVKQKCHVELQNEDVYMATTYEAFIQKIARKGRGLDDQVFEYDAVSVLMSLSQYSTFCFVLIIIIIIIIITGFYIALFQIMIKALHSVILPRSYDSESILHSECTFSTP